MTNVSRLRSARARGPAAAPASAPSPALPQRALVLTGADPNARHLAAALMDAGLAVQLAADAGAAPAAIETFGPQIVLARLASFSGDAAEEAASLRAVLKPAGIPLIVALTPTEALTPALADALRYADDFLLEPMAPTELALRYAVCVLRAQERPDDDALVSGRLTLDLVGRKVLLDSQTVSLTHKEFEMVRFLATHRGRVVTREMMLEKLWGRDYYGGLRTVDVHIRRIRSKLEIGGFRCIETVRNVGYKFVEDGRGAGTRSGPWR